MKKRIFLIFIIIISVLSLVGFKKEPVCRNLLDLYQSPEYTEKGLADALNYDPDMGNTPLPDPENKDFFESIDDWSICRRRSVRKYLYIYLTKNREYIINAIERSYLYEDIISKEFKNFSDIPKDILLLPLLESGFNPYAVSRAKAVGLWQFIRSTSSILGLKRDYWIDERRDIEKSTRAALTHLTNIYGYFNSWDLSLAAYNGGTTHVLQSIRKAQTDDYWKLRKTGYLRTETGEFLPRLAALIIIYKYRHLFGLDKEIMPRERSNSILISVSNPVDLKRLSKITGLSIEELRLMNPELKRDTIPPYSQYYNLRIPLEVLKRINANIDNPLMLRYVNL